MNDEPTTVAPHQECGWVKLWHPRGAHVTIPLICPAEMMLEKVSALLGQGWKAEAPGLEAGEEKESIGWVLRSAFEKDGKATPFILLYANNDSLTWSILKVYLNTLEDREAFEYASGLAVDKLPDYIGNDKPQRTASAKTDRFIVKAPRPFGVVYKKNPKHDDSEAGKLKPARLFVRWEDEKPNGGEKAQPAQSQAPQKGFRERYPDVYAKWASFFGEKPVIETVNTALDEANSLPSGEVRVWVLDQLDRYAKKHGWGFDLNHFTDPAWAESPF